MSIFTGDLPNLDVDDRLGKGMKVDFDNKEPPIHFSLEIVSLNLLLDLVCF